METIKQEIQEFVVEGRRLGRHIFHDPRSLQYPASQFLSPQMVPRSQVWRRHTLAYNQGNIGSCTGNAAAGMMMTAPFYSPGRAPLSETDALRLYEEATQIDSPGRGYPPNDNGSSGLSVMKAARREGLVRAYYHIFDLSILVMFLGWVGPVIFGCNWYGGFDSPDSAGVCRISPNDSVRGGHEVEIIGVDVEAQTIRFCNSWGPTWGDHGCGQFTWTDFQRLMDEQGDITVGIK